jgi:hypothetical protein
LLLLLREGRKPREERFIIGDLAAKGCIEWGTADHFALRELAIYGG